MHNIENFIKPNILKYVNENIKPLYEKEETGHDWKHIQAVLDNANYIIDFIFKDDELVHDMIGTIFGESFSYTRVYIAIIYHDISLTYGMPRESHQYDSSEIFFKDEFMREQLTSEDRFAIMDAIKKHRASSHCARNLLERIVFQSDRGFRGNSYSNVFKRSFTFNKAKNPKLSNIEVAKLAYDHIKGKYGVDGYAYETIYFETPDVVKFQNDMYKFISILDMILKEEE